MADDARPKMAKVRKRAPKACLSCRARKVRCDVSQRGRPCMNCYLDSETCVVTGRAARLRKSQKAAAAATATSTTTTATAAASAELAHNHSHAHTRHSPPLSDVSDPTSPGPPVSVMEYARDSQTPQSEVRQTTLPVSFQDGPSSHVSLPQPPSQPHDRQPLPHEHHNSCSGHDGHSHNQRHGHGHGHGSYPPRLNGSNANCNGYGGMDANIMNMSSANMNTGMGRSQWTPESLSMTADITYSYYPFLCISNVSGILPQDVNYLELQGCLRVPTRAALDEFVQQFFLHVHPLLPMFHEGDFWDLYCQQAAGVGGSGETPCGRMSLFVLQAMLFATCSYVPRSTLRALGFSTVRQARTAFYRRAKLLFDFETESSPAAMAQGALLLSYWSPSTSPGIKAPNTGWLCKAIHYARVAEAHHYARMGGDDSSSGTGSAADACRAKALKRLWWCCIIRDRLMSLGVRRPLQIARVNFDLDTNPPLCRADLADETDRSRVYNPGTKACLIELTLQLAKMCVVITDMLTVVFPQDDSPGWARQPADCDAARVRQCKQAMRQWHQEASAQFPMFSSGSSNGSTHNSNNVGKGHAFCHDSVILYTNLMHMYYHSARVALCHHEALHVAVANAVAATQGPDATGTRQSVVYKNRAELHDAASGVIESLKELIQRRLARWLPVSAVACSALPLFLHILDVKLSTSAAAAAAASTPAPILTIRDDGPPSSRVDTSTSSSSSSSSSPAPSALKRHRLNVLIEAMKTYQPQYDGVDWVSETIRHLVNLAQLDGPATNASDTATNASDWTDILTTNPSWYLRLALTMDLALSKNRMPEERDFPVSLRGMFASSGFIPVRRLGFKGVGDSDHLGPSAGLHPGGNVGGGVNIFSSCSNGPMGNPGVHPPPTAPATTPVMATTDNDSLDDSFAHTFPTDSFLASHPFASIMADMDLDLDGTNGTDGADGTDTNKLFPTPGVVTQLPSSADDDSPGSGNEPSTASDEGPAILSAHDRSLLDAYTFDDDGLVEPRPQPLNKTAPRARGEWMETVWDNDGSSADRDTARALLDAMGAA